MLYQSERDFEVLQFALTEPSRLIVRSPRDEDHDTRIDIEFRELGFVSLRTRYTGLHIRAATRVELEVITTKYGVEFDIGRVFFLSAGLTDFVSSARPVWIEDGGYFRDPTQFGPFPSRV